MQLLHEEVSIEEKLVELRQVLLVHDEVLFSQFFERARSKHHLIVTFLAVLEMVRLSEISLHQKKAFDEIYIRKIKTAGNQAV
jgi:segregation and condensation protein A